MYQKHDGKIQRSVLHFSHLLPSIHLFESMKMLVYRLTPFVFIRMSDMFDAGSGVIWKRKRTNYWAGLSPHRFMLMYFHLNIRNTSCILPNSMRRRNGLRNLFFSLQCVNYVNSKKKKIFFSLRQHWFSALIHFFFFLWSICSCGFFFFWFFLRSVDTFISSWKFIGYATWIWPKLLLFVFCVSPMIYFIFNKIRKWNAWSSSFDVWHLKGNIGIIKWIDMLCAVYCFSHRIDDLFDFVHQRRESKFATRTQFSFSRSSYHCLNPMPSLLSVSLVNIL